MLRSHSLDGHLHMRHTTFYTELLHVVRFVAKYLHRCIKSQGAGAARVSYQFASREVG